MSIKMTKNKLRNIVREEYMRSINELASGEEMSRESAEAMHDLAFAIAKKLAREIDNTSMGHQINKAKLLSAVIDQVKLHMKG